jgi:hypothetical protein
VAPRDECTSLPKLCTDAVLLRGYETTLTYLCPETEGPSTVTVTTTATTTVTGELVSVTTLPDVITSDVWATASEQPTPNIPVVSTSDTAASTSDEPTTTVIIQSTVLITITREIGRVTHIPSSSSLPPPPTITWSFTAILPTDQPPHSLVKSSSVPAVDDPSTASSVGPPTSSASSSFNLFPSHTVSNSSSVASTSSTDIIFTRSVLHHVPPYENRTAISYTPGELPTMNVARDEHSHSTKTVTSTVAVPTETKKGQAGDTRASFIALFFGVLAATWLI